jgi:hypothetical protein
MTGGCRSGFSRVEGGRVERICFRSCRVDGDCPAGAACRTIAVLAGAKLCYVP